MKPQVKTHNEQQSGAILSCQRVFVELCTEPECRHLNMDHRSYRGDCLGVDGYGLCVRIDSLYDNRNHAWCECKERDMYFPWLHVYEVNVP